MAIKKYDPLVSLLGKGSASYGLATGDFSTKKSQEPQANAKAVTNWQLGGSGVVSAMWNLNANTSPAKTEPVVSQAHAAAQPSDLKKTEQQQPVVSAKQASVFATVKAVFVAAEQQLEKQLAQRPATKQAEQLVAAKQKPVVPEQRVAVARPQGAVTASNGPSAENIRQAIATYGSYLLGPTLKNQILESLDKPDPAMEASILRQLEPLKSGSAGPYVVQLASFYEGRRAG